MVDISQIAVSDCFARANVCALRGSYKIRAFRSIGTCRNIVCEKSTARPSSENKASGFSPERSKSTVVSVQYNALVDQNLQSKIRAERVSKTKKNLSTDACSDHSQTSDDTQIVFGDLTSVGEFQSWQSPRSCCTSQKSMISGN